MKSVLLVIPANVSIHIALGLTGMAVFAYYAHTECDVLASGLVKNSNQILSYFVATMFQSTPGFAGLFLIMLYGAALSTVSSALSGVSANIWEDILKAKVVYWPESKKLLFNRALVIIVGCAASGVAFAVAFLPGPIQTICNSFIGCVTGPLVGLFFLGGLSKHGNWKGVLFGTVMSLSIMLWLNLGTLSAKITHPPLPAVSVNGCYGYHNETYTSWNNNGTIGSWHGNERNETWYHNEKSMLMSMISKDDRTAMGQNNNDVEPFTALERLYSISYQWYPIIGTLLTLVIGLVTSLILRDRDAEERVIKRFLIQFQDCHTWSADNDFEEHEDKSLHEITRLDVLHQQRTPLKNENQCS